MGKKNKVYEVGVNSKTEEKDFYKKRKIWKILRGKVIKMEKKKRVAFSKI